MGRRGEGKGLEHFVLEISFKKGERRNMREVLRAQAAAPGLAQIRSNHSLHWTFLGQTEKQNPQGIYPRGREERNKNPAGLGSAPFSVLFHSLLHQQVSLWALQCSSREGNESFTENGETLILSRSVPCTPVSSQGPSAPLLT